ncbi:MAG TPA: hypothetical protein VJL89_13640, partial [Thermodesulfovibrionia bacterium]|nr:hypothetical protein [Thermodesulfovibrionia bacterium]
MTTESAIERKLETVFSKKQASVLAKVITDSYQELVKSDDLHELKTDVKELKTDVKELKTDVKELKTDVKELKT